MTVLRRKASCRDHADRQTILSAERDSRAGRWPERIQSPPSDRDSGQPIKTVRSGGGKALARPDCLRTRQCFPASLPHRNCSPWGRLPCRGRRSLETASRGHRRAGPHRSARHQNIYWFDRRRPGAVHRRSERAASRDKECRSGGRTSAATKNWPDPKAHRMRRESLLPDST